MAEGRYLKEFWSTIGLWALNAAGVEVAILAENDGTPRVQLIGYDGSSQTRVLTSTAGILETLLFGDANGTDTTISLEDTSAELKVVNYGKDSGGNIDALRTNASQQLQVEVVSEGLSLSSIILGQDDDVSTETVLYTTPASTVTVVDKIVAANREATANTVSIGFSAGGGALANVDYIIYQFDVPANDSLVLDGPYYMAAADELRVIAEDANVTLSAYGREYA